MVAARVDTFGGMVPATDPRLLPLSAATHAVNCWLYTGKLSPLREPKELFTCNDPETAKVYRIPESYGDASSFNNSFWMEFSNPFTDVIRAPVFDDQYDRYYWFSSSEAPKYNTKTRILNGDPPWLLGIPRPSAAPTVGVTGGSAGNITRAYVATYVSEYGEEGPPSEAELHTGQSDGTWNIDLPTPDPDDIGGPDRNLTHVRIYRTITSSAGVATFFFVAEQAIADETYDDSLSDTEVSAQGQLQTDGWTGPPADLQGAVMMPNGIVAAWRENEVWFSEPYRPHAWPVDHVLTVEHPIVGMGVINQSLIVCTSGKPVIISGVTPLAMSQDNPSQFEPCIGRGSIISAPEGVYYTSPNGLILANPGSINNITREIVTKEEWVRLTNRTRFRAARLGTAYIGFGSVSAGVFQDDAFQEDAFAQEDTSGAYNGILIDPVNPRAGFSLVNEDETVLGVQMDDWSGEVLILKGGKVYWQDQADSTQPYRIAFWRSKTIEMVEENNFAALKVRFSLDDTAPDLNPTRNTALLQTLAADQYGLIRLYAGDELVSTRELRKNGEVFRPPSGFTADSWYFELETRVKINDVQLASTAAELARV